MNRFINKQSILSLNIPQYGQIYTDVDYSNLHHDKLIPTINSLTSIQDNLVSELHVFTVDGDYLGSAINSKLYIDTSTKNIFFDIREVFAMANITRGSYKLVFNLLYPVLGRPDRADVANINWPLVLKEISPDRTELKLVVTNTNIDKLSNFKEYVKQLSSVDLLNNLCINFGENNINKIINIKFDSVESNVIYVKLYNQLSNDIELSRKSWFSVDLMDSYVDTILLTSEIVSAPTNTLKGPNFRIDADGYASKSTTYQSWNDLLDSDLPTTNKILDSLLSGSMAHINIDYSDYSNFVFYSRASSRIENFKTKLEQIEKYRYENKLLTETTASTTNILTTNIQLNVNRVDKIVSSLSPFESWLYNHSTSSIFTHGISGSLTPYPKYINDNKVVLYSTTSSLAQNWYETNYYSASLFDERNYNSLWWSIPEHLLMTEDNSDYVAFVNMVGEHFDTLYSYTKALTQIHERDEHPEVGASNDLLEYIAKSFGWELQDARQLSSLWLYKLGTTHSGSMFTSSNMPVLAHEAQTHQIWKRTVNNLPYLLKTKGTDRSVKALMSIYGIPQTLLSIKEYGGPGLNIDRPLMAENRYAYTFKLTRGHNSMIQIPLDTHPISEFGVGTGAYCGGVQNIIGTSGPITTEFRFSTEFTSSDMLGLYYTYENSGTEYAAYAISLHHSSVSSSIQQSNDIISGSNYYGRIVLETFQNGINSYDYNYSDYLPLFDGDLWTVRITRNSLSGSNTPIKLDIARVSDCLYGRISHSASFEVAYPGLTTTPNSGSSYSMFGIESDYVEGTGINVTGSATGNIVGWDGWFEHNIQEFKQYWTEYSLETFYEHVLNPSAYHTDSISGSYYSLLRYHPLGGDTQRYDHTIVTHISSSHPNRNIHTSLAQVSYGGPPPSGQTEWYDSINETYYISVPSLAGHTVMSDKIRLESSQLKYDLSPTHRSEESYYDRSGFDSNRLAIVFSLADQVNRDIANHMGLGEIDSWVGSPADEFEGEYSTFKNKSNEYWQKYQQINNLNSFIRLLSLYDYTFFEQTKQLAPGRADLITGILVEPTVLERSKVQVTRRPTIENLYHEDYINLNMSSGSGEYVDLNDSIPITGSTEINYNYQTGSIPPPFNTEINNSYQSGSVLLNENVEYTYNYQTGSVNYPWEVSTSAVINTIDYYDTIQVIDPYSGSVGCTHSIIDIMRPDCRYKKKTYLYESYNIKESLIPYADLYDLSKFEIYSASIVKNTTTQINEYSNIAKEKLRWGVYVDDGFYTNSNTPIQLIVGNKYTIRILFDPIAIGPHKSAPSLYEIEGTDPTGSNMYIATGYVISGSYNNSKWVNYLEYYFTASYEYSRFGIGVDPEPGLVYSFELYPYRTKYQEQWYRKAYEQSNLAMGSKTETHYYQIDECSSYNRARFVGSKLVGAGINIDSPNTIDGGPVVEIREVNPNILLNNNRDSNGNLRIE